MHLIEVTPAPCSHCGRGNTQSMSSLEEPLRFVDLERDINWNDPLILCEDCIAKVAGMVGMASKDSLRELQREITRVNKELHDTKAEKENMERRAHRLGMTFETV
jgi:hypothetical protein